MITASKIELSRFLCRSTFLVMAGVCGVGCLALTRLIARTRKVYRDMYKTQQAKDMLAAKGNLGEVHMSPLTSFEALEEPSFAESPVLKSSNMPEAQRHRRLSSN